MLQIINIFILIYYIVNLFNIILVYENNIIYNIMNYSNYTKNICYKNELHRYNYIIFIGNTTIDFIKTYDIKTICDHNRLLYYLYSKNNLLNNEINDILKYIVIDSKLSVTKLIKHNRSENSINILPKLIYSYENNTIYHEKFNKNIDINNSIIDNIFLEPLYIFEKYKNLYNITTDIFIKKLIKIICFLRYRIENRLYTLGI